MSNSELNPEFEALLNYIRHNRGFDFTGYKRSTLTRRVTKRMQESGIESYSDYIDYLEVHPQEFIELFNTLLINVTSFFRDQSVWEYLKTEIIPQILASKRADQPIRIWSAGCASGQEAYTLAMVLAEALGVEQFCKQVKIYATDLDEDALNQSRNAIYTAKEVADIPTELLERYFEHSNSNYTFRKDLRRSVIFGRHNLVSDAPMSRIDLLTCRNTLMYFNAETQAKIIARFHFALNDGSFLLLGKAEMLLSHSNYFTALDLKRRIFVKVPKAITRSTLLLMNNKREDEEANYLTRNVRLRDAAFDANPVAQVVVDLNGFLTLANEQARSLFGLSPIDLGRSLQDLEFCYRPVNLPSYIEQACNERQPVNLKNVEWRSPAFDSQHFFDVQVAPLWDVSGSRIGVTITFTDVTHSKRLTEELEQSNQELEMAYEELQSTNEELETTNEELQSSNEELETTNEELQSTNEELETMNEELQSTNEELQTMNEELRQRTSELNEVNDLLESILTSLRGAVVVIDRNLHVLVWSNKAEDLWGLRASEVQGQQFFNLDIGLPVEQLLQPIRACLAGDFESSQVTLNATNRRGKAIQCQVSWTPVFGTGKEIQGAIILMEEQVAAEA